MTTPARDPKASPIRTRPPRNIGQMIGNELRAISFQPSPAPRACAHPLGSALPHGDPPSCQGCVRDATTPVKLRMCLTCGSVGCCDSSVGRHAVGHFAQTGHPVMRSIEAGDSWGWCYVDEAYLSGSLAPWVA